MTPGGRLHVLVVDDSEILLRAMVRTLSRAYTVTTARDGLEALERIRGGEVFDVIVCDVSMPRMNGVELYVALQRESPRSAERFVFATGGTSVSSLGHLVDEGIPVLLKPVSASEVRAAIEAFAVEAKDEVG